jgi:hypothetical protein
VFRPFSFTFGAGPGILRGPGERDMALTYGFRVGIGVAPNVAFLVGLDGGGISTTSFSGDESWLSQNIWSFGTQIHFLRRFFARAGLGIGHLREETDFETFYGGNGVAFVGGAGFELVQSPDVALALELFGVSTRYASEIWSHGGVQFTLAVF